MSECRIHEYDGSFRCYTHRKDWGAITDADPCLTTLQSQLTASQAECKRNYDIINGQTEEIADLRSRLEHAEEAIKYAAQRIEELNAECDQLRIQANKDSARADRNAKELVEALKLVDEAHNITGTLNDSDPAWKEARDWLRKACEIARGK